MRSQIIIPILFVLVCVVGCVTSEVTPIGSTYPARETGCKIDVFPATTPAYQWEDIASVESKCHFTMGRSACIEKLKEEACKAGADAVYGFNEGRIEEYTIITATLAKRTGEPIKVSGPTPPPQPMVGCSPPCSPGYDCQGTTCVPLCNPPCAPGMVCGMDRTCQPEEKPASQPAPEGEL
jgi:hypothetical protein